MDLISYTICALHPKILVAEAAPGSGAMCGSSFINRKFRQLLQDRFGSDENYEEDTEREALDKFEYDIKRNFHGEEDYVEILLPGMPDSAERGVKRNFLRLHRDEMIALFEVAVLPTTVLVKAQIEKTGVPVKAVPVVGGFGQSPWLQKKIQEVIGGSVLLHLPSNGETAIVRGALDKGLAHGDEELAHVKVESRVARRSYGVKCNVLFDPEVHYASDR